MTKFQLNLLGFVMLFNFSIAPTHIDYGYVYNSPSEFKNSEEVERSIINAGNYSFVTFFKNIPSNDKILFFDNVLNLIEIKKNYFQLKKFLTNEETTPQEISNIIKKANISKIWNTLLKNKNIIQEILYTSFINILNMKTLNPDEMNPETASNRFYGYTIQVLFYMIKLELIFKKHSKKIIFQTSRFSQKHVPLSQGSETYSQQNYSILTEDDDKFDPDEIPLFSEETEESFESSLYHSDSESEDEVIRYAHSPEEFLIIAKNDLILYENSIRNSISNEESYSRDEIEKAEKKSFEKAKSIEKINELKKFTLNLLNNYESLRDVERDIYKEQQKPQYYLVRKFDLKYFVGETVVSKFYELLKNSKTTLNMNKENIEKMVNELSVEGVFYLLKNIKNLQYRSGSETELSEQSNSSKKRKMSSQPEDLETNDSVENKRYKTESTTDILSYHTSQVLNVPLNQAEFD